MTNWNRQIHYQVADDQYEAPQSVEEVQAIVRRAVRDNKKVTVVGARHSTTECIVGTGIVISMEKMNRVLEVNQEKKEVTVEAGVTLHQLCRRLKAARLRPGVILEFGNFQIGAISGTHANDTSVTQEGQFSSFVTGIKLVTPSGDLLQVSEGQNPELLPYLRSHFGMFGVVCEVTLRVIESQPLKISTQSFEIDRFTANFDSEVRKLKQTQDQVFGMLFPHTGKLLWQCRKFVEPQATGLLHPESWDDPLLRKGINLYKDVLLPGVRRWSAYSSGVLADLLSQAIVQLPLQLFGQGDYVIDPCDRGIIYEDDDADFDFYDWVFPEDQWCNMVRAFLKLAERFRHERQFALPLPTLIYFVKHDRASMLSRSRDADMMAVDPTYPDPENSTWKEFRIAFNEVAMRHGGIPHINKTRDGALAHFAGACDQVALESYLAKRKAMDPNDTFLNPYFETMFLGSRGTSSPGTSQSSPTTSQSSPGSSQSSLA